MKRLELALSRVTIADVLTDEGIATNRSGKIGCPFEKQSSRPTFRYSQLGFECSSCKAKGGILELIQLIGGVSRHDAIKALFRLADIPLEDSLTLDTAGTGKVGRGRAHGKPCSVEQTKENLERELDRLLKAYAAGRVSEQVFYQREEALQFELDELAEGLSHKKRMNNSVPETPRTEYGHKARTNQIDV